MKTQVEENRYYSRQIKMPANKKEGLENFVQLIINQIEAGESNEALLTAVDLLNDLWSGIYSEVDTEAGRRMVSVQAELERRHTAELNKAREAAFAAGQESARLEIAMKLGLSTVRSYEAR